MPIFLNAKPVKKTSVPDIIYMIEKDRYTQGNTKFYLAQIENEDERERRAIEWFGSGPPIYTAIFFQSIQATKALLPYHSVIHTEDQHGRTLLAAAASVGFLPLLEMILNCVVSPPHYTLASYVNKTDDDGYDALSCAARGDHLVALKFLLENGAYRIKQACILAKNAGSYKAARYLNAWSNYIEHTKQNSSTSSKSDDGSTRNKTMRNIIKQIQKRRLSHKKSWHSTETQPRL